VPGDHTVELPGGDDHPQGGPGLGRRLYDRVEAGDRHTLLRLGLVRVGRARGVPKGVFSCVTGPWNEIGGELTNNLTVRKLQIDLHRFDRDQQIADAAMRRNG
jgi:hypothetical protein